MQKALKPMTLDNMRANGVRTLAAWCGGRGCNHLRVFDVSAYPDDVPVPSFGPSVYDLDWVQIVLNPLTG
jgi:hypothetical protein